MNCAASAALVRRPILRTTRIRHSSSRNKGGVKLLQFSSTSSNDSTTSSSEYATLQLLQQVKDGTLSIEKAGLELSRFNKNPNSESSSSSSSAAAALSSFANIDHDRYTRTNFPEVIFAQSKTSYQVATILDEMAERQITKLLLNHQTAVEVTPKQEHKKCYLPPILATRYVMNFVFLHLVSRGTFRISMFITNAAIILVH